MPTSDVYLGNPNLKRANTAHEFTEEQVIEFLKCKEDPVNIASNNIQDKKTLLIFIDAKEKEIMKRLKKRAGFNLQLYKSMKKNQMPLLKKRKKCNIVIKNNFKKGFILKQIKKIKDILKKDRSSTRY